MKMIDNVITLLYEVPGMTNDELRLYAEKASVYVIFRDGSGTLRRFVNFLNINHVYCFDSEGICKFAGYVGWIHSEGLKDELRLIKKVFEDN